MPIQPSRCPAARRLALLAAFLIAPLASPARAGEATPPPLAAITVGSRMDAAAYQAEARVEAVRQAALAVPVAGAVTELKVLAGDRVAAGQMLLQVEGKAAADQAAAAHAQIAAAEAQRVQARQEYARAQALAAQKFLSA
ncbi:MAG: biotin/lipoyl-binding protein, partial [Azospira sp.]